MYRKKFSQFSLTICLLLTCLFTIQVPADNENEPPEHTHIIVTMDWGYCWCPLPYVGLPKLHHDGCISVYTEGGFEWTSYKTCFETHGVPACPMNCGIDVDAEDEHLSFCYDCTTPYYTCQEYHDGSSQCGSNKY